MADQRPSSTPIPTRLLGHTGRQVPILGIGGYHIGSAGPELGVRIVREAIDAGVTFLDNAWCYHQGRSEEIMGRALADGYRQKVFLMTKNHGRDAETFRRQFDQSLRRLGVHHVDLLQLHDIRDPDEPHYLFRHRVLDAAMEAKSAGRVRFLGFSGHFRPEVLEKMLDLEQPWDAVQLPVNLLDAHFRSFQQRIIPKLRERGIGVIGMKSLASGHLLKTGIAARDAITYALSQPIDVLVCGMDSLEVLRENLETVRSFQPLSPERQKELLARSKPYAAKGELEDYKHAHQD
ncbi:MAG: aldo/keto reductase [Planctomycetes bacterium]|nr:aldo/keto reductase [Planctomycetota bacterium]